MRPRETITALAGFEGRGPGTDAERRTAQWLARELVANRQRVRVETFWCRPNWALAHAWHVALALLGSLLSVSHPTIGAALLAMALASTVADDVLGTSLGRRLTPERASQNVIATARSSGPRHGHGPGAGREETPEEGPRSDPPARLIVTANYDAGRTGLIYRDRFRATAARVRRATGGFAPGWLAWVVLAIAYELAIAIVRLTQHHPPHVLGVLQLPPAVALVLALALLLEAAGAGYGPAAGDNASGTAVALELARTVTADLAHHDLAHQDLAIELVLQGAGQDEQIGLRRYLKARKRELRHANVAVLGIAASASGRPAWWLSDGRLIPVRYARTLRTLAEHTTASAHRGRGSTPALPARAAGLPAIAIGCLDDRGLAPRSHQRSDTPDHIDEAALNGAIALGLMLIASIRTATQG
jgi:Peptidase family M28